MAQFGEVRVDFITYTTGVVPNEGTVTTSVSGLISSGGGGATGSGGDRVFVLNQQTVTTSYTFPSGNNATSCGPITVNDGVEVIVGDNQNWSIV